MICNKYWGGNWQLNLLLKNSYLTGFYMYISFRHIFLETYTNFVFEKRLKFKQQ